MKTDSINTEQLFNLEMWLIKNYPENIMCKDLYSYLLTIFNEIEVDYLISAYIMPFRDISEQLQIYDTTKPKMDELKFIRNLQERYNVDEEQIIARIRDVRKINKYLTKHLEIINEITNVDLKKLILKSKK